MSDKREPHRGVVVKTSAGDAAVQLERLISKQKYKDAVKQAKLIHKAEATPQSHRQLERAYFLRAQQLLRAGMPASAVEVSRHLLDFGVTDAKLVEDFSPLLVKLGLAQDAFRIQGRLESPESQSRLLLLAADQAVLHPERSHRSSPEVQEAALVRQALEALYAGDEATALGLVRDIARSSPVSEWKLLVRGLAAFYRGDHGETQANWNRLDPERAPLRIARHLQDLHQGQSEKDAGGTDFEELEGLVYGERILPRLRELSVLVANNRWVDVLRRTTSLRLSLRTVDPRLAEKLTSSLLTPLLDHATSLGYASGTRLLREFTQVAEPLAIDPGWNRLWALTWERPLDGTSEAIKYWTRYIADLERCAALKAEERPLAQALVWKHMAQLYLAELDDRSEEDEDLDFDDDFDLEDEGENALDLDEDRLAQQATTYIERSLQLAPRHRPTYELLVQLCRMSNEPEKLTQAWRRILEVFPEDVETLVEMASELHDRDEPATALEILSRARKLKPLDESLVDLEMMIRTSLARSLALQKRWDEGRAQFAAMEQLRPDELRVFSYLARKAIFETKAGQVALAGRYEREAGALLPEPAPLWLSLHVESIRFRLPKATQNRYAELWMKELRRKCRSETAGAMASFLTAFFALDIGYDGRAHDAAEVLKYLRRTTRLNYRLEDLEDVCEFLGHFPKESGLTRKLVQRGLKANPESALLHLAVAGVELSDPAAVWRLPDVRGHLQAALRLAEASTRRREMLMVPKIKQMLSVSNELHSRMAGLPFGAPGHIPVPGGKPGSFEDFLGAILGAAMEEDKEEEEEEEEDDGGPRSFASRELPASRRTNRRSGRKPKSGS
jgi:tetratricopeptide (TPR) repeat protein